MALVSANYEFIYVDVGAEGHQSDGGICRECSLKKSLDKGKVDLPKSKLLPRSEIPCEYVILGDDAFPLGDHLLKPFCRRKLSKTERIFNYRLSRARRCAENAFGILASRFRLFLTEIDAHPDKVEQFVLAAICLHNMLLKKCGRSYISPGSVDLEDVDNNFIPGDWRKQVNLDSFEADEQRNAPTPVKQQRLRVRDYFSSPAGSVPWQDHMI